MQIEKGLPRGSPFFQVPVIFPAISASGLNDFSGLQTAGADPDGFHLARDHRPDSLEVGVEDALGDAGDVLSHPTFFLGLAFAGNAPPGQGMFPANRTDLGHVGLPRFLSFW